MGAELVKVPLLVTTQLERKVGWVLQRGMEKRAAELNMTPTDLQKMKAVFAIGNKAA